MVKRFTDRRMGAARIGELARVQPIPARERDDSTGELWRIGRAGVWRRLPGADDGARARSAAR